MEQGSAFTPTVMCRWKNSPTDPYPTPTSSHLLLFDKLASCVKWRADSSLLCI